MSELKSVEFRGIASPVDGLCRVAVLTFAPDGWRVYEAACVVPAGDEAARQEAISWCRRSGNKLSPDEARRYFNITSDMKFAR